MWRAFRLLKIRGRPQPPRGGARAAPTASQGALDNGGASTLFGGPEPARGSLFGPAGVDPKMEDANDRVCAMARPPPSPTLPSTTIGSRVLPPDL
eukprot:gene3168-3696_t